MSRLDLLLNLNLSRWSIHTLARLSEANSYLTIQNHMLTQPDYITKLGVVLRVMLARVVLLILVLLNFSRQGNDDTIHTQWLMLDAKSLRYIIVAG
jgi:hypothetical protein